ncbi:unnamed protein product [Spirodela intermedia]|uniref:BHLH domain-containing protein n=1 Tax=Spirodela intermedia TaxID=51605 RepID=A0A7I8KHQ6_SPIIN|nr:unnamed protein product [Spirodela intermedia]
MDATNNTSTGGRSWDIDITMGNQLFLDQLPLELLPMEHHPQTHQLPSSTGLPVLQEGNPIRRDAADGRHGGGGDEEEEEEEENLGPMKEMMYRIASMQPVDIDPATIKKPKRRNVHISDDPQSTAARHRRERISERIRILQRLVPGGTKLDTASMLDEAIRYVKYLKRQVQVLESTQVNPPEGTVGGHLAPADNWACTGAESLDPTSGAAAASSSIGISEDGSSAVPAASTAPSTVFSFPHDGSYSHMHLPFS